MKKIFKGEILEAHFSKKVPFLANIDHCPKFLEYALPISYFNREVYFHKFQQVTWIFWEPIASFS